MRRLCLAALIVWGALIALPASAAKPSPGHPQAKAHALSAKTTPSAPRSSKAKRQQSTDSSRTRRAGHTAQVRPHVVHFYSPPPAAPNPASETFLQHGCLSPNQGVVLTGKLGLEAGSEQMDLWSTSSAELGPSGDLPCIAFAAVSAPPDGGSSIAVVKTDLAGGENTMWLLSRSASQAAPTTQTMMFSDTAAGRREFLLPAEDLDMVSEFQMGQIPAHLRWELALIIRKMISAIDSAPLYHLRLILQEGFNRGPDRVAALELVETATGRSLDNAVWLERKDRVGAYFSTTGIDYERVLWQSPLRSLRISRGVQQSVLTVRKAVLTRPKNRKKKPRLAIQTFQYHGQHTGVDFPAPIGTPVHAVADAEVIFAGVRGGYGNLIILDHGADHHTYYAHLSAFAPDLEVGSRVLRGAQIGQVGSTGFSTGPHLHFEWRKASRYLNPLLAESRLEFWSLNPEDHGLLLARLLMLDRTRQAVRPQLSLGVTTDFAKAH